MRLRVSLNTTLVCERVNFETSPVLKKTFLSFSDLRFGRLSFHLFLSSVLIVRNLSRSAVSFEVKWSSSRRLDLAIHFQSSWPTTSECFSYPYAVPKFIQLRHRPHESVKNARWLTLWPWDFYSVNDKAN